MPLLEDGAGSVVVNLFEIDVNTGKGKLFAAGERDTGGWIMDGAGHVVARLDQTRQSRVQKLMVPAGDREWREVAAVPATADSGLNVLGLSEDGKAVIRLAESGGRDVLARVDLSTGQETVLLSGSNNDIDDVYRDRWTGRIVGATVDGEGAFFDSERLAVHRGLRKAFPGLAVREESSDVSHRKLVAGVSGPRNPAVYYYLDRDTKVVDEIMSSYPGLQSPDLGEMKAYDYKARDGLTIPAFITLPPGREPRNLPAIVMPHGGPDARDSLGFDWWAQFLANRGYAVLQPNYRGSTGYGAAFNQAGHGQWGLKMQDDISDGVRKMIADGIADPNRVCIVGASYGGYAALAGATLTPDLYACAVSVAGVSDLPKMISHERSTYGKKSGAVLFWISRIGSPDDDSERLRATSPARQAAQVRAPIMLMHGELDTTVPIEQSEIMAEALARAGKPVTFVKLQGDDHYLHLASTRLQMLTEIEKFLNANIGR
jgi:dipeptidyl aminopeptidase/acylaminoacyl peptidase